MKLITLGKGLCVLLLVLCVSVISYAELIITHGLVYQQLELQNDTVNVFSNMPVVRQLKEYCARRRLARPYFNTDIEEAMLKARIQKKIIGTAV